MKAQQYIQTEIRELGDEQAQLGARVEQIEAAVQTLIQERTDALTRTTAIDADLSALRRALATLQEHVPTTAVEVIDADTTPAPTEVSPAPRALPPGTPHRRSHPDPVKAAKKAANREHVRCSINPLQVTPRNIPEGRSSPRSKPTQMVYEGEITLRRADLSPTVRERADLLLEVMDENEGTMSQYQMAVKMADLLNAKMPSAQSIVTQCLRVLAYHHEVVWTGQKVATRPGGRLASPVWKIATPPERASAGIPITDDNFAGRTTRMYTNTEARVQVESSGFEQGKRS